MTDQPDDVERAYTRLFQRLPTEPLPLGFRDAVMTRVARERRARPWEWIVAAAVAVPSLLFILWELVAHGNEVGLVFANIFDAVVGPEGWLGAEASFEVDGLLVLAIACVGLAGILMAHAALAGGDSRSRLHPA